MDSAKLSASALEWEDKKVTQFEEEQVGIEEEINLQKSITKEAMQAVCKEHNTTIKEFLDL